MNEVKMARQKKIKTVQDDEKLENTMSEENKLETIQQEIDSARAELENTKREIEEKKLELKRIPAREVSEEEKKIMSNQVTMTNEKNSLKEKIERQRAYDSEPVTGRFMNRRAPGQPVKLPYIKHATDPVKWYPLEDGKVYTIPRGFADQLNGGTEDDPCYYTPHFTQKAGEMDPNKPASAIHAVDSSNKKYAFTPINF